jgi:hypothetical protein
MGDDERIRREHLAAGAIYGTVAYLTILVLLEEDRTDPEDAVAIPVVPLFLAMLGLLEDRAGLRAAIAACVLSPPSPSGKHGRRASAGVAPS